MGFRKKQSVTRPDAPQPVARKQAEKLQRRASDLADPVDKQTENNSSARLRRFQRQQIERQMARLRREAVQARRLAEYVENLSRDAAAQQRKRKPVMTDTNIVDPGHAQRLKRRSEDRPASGGGQMSFNPLHPSMELPPEQLIRLLGMESKKTRKVRKTASPAPASAKEHRSKPQQAPAPAETARLESRPERNHQYPDSQPPMFDNSRRNLLVPALLVGVVAGISVSAYLLMSQPVPVAEQKPAVVSSVPAKKPQTAAKQANRKPAAGSKAPAMTIQEQAAWQADIEQENQRLQAAAKQRLAERIRQLEASAAAPPVVENTASQPAPYATPDTSLETAAPEQQQLSIDPPADNTPDTASGYQPGSSYERLLDRSITGTPAATVPVTPEITPDEAPAQAEPLPYAEDEASLFMQNSLEVAEEAVEEEETASEILDTDLPEEMDITESPESQTEILGEDEEPGSF